MLHTGDFKMDQLPLDGRITDLRHFARLGEEGVDLFLTDSTNAEVPGFTPPEKEIGPVLADVFGTPRSASSSRPSPRTSTACSRCSTPPHAHGRKVAFVGRSMVRNMGIAAKLGYLEVPTGILVDREGGRQAADSRWSYMCTGSQGEPMAALSPHGQRRPQGPASAEGDTVILASSLIPGNENAVFRVDQRAHAAGRQRGPQGHRQGARLRARRARASCCTATTSSSPRTSCRSTARSATCIANGKLAEETGVPSDRVHPGRGRHRGGPARRRGADRGPGRVRLRLRGRLLRG